MVETPRSADGTTLTYGRTGEGPPLILAGGALNNRHSGAPLAAVLAPRFSVVCYDRRGRGDSGDTPPYAVAREVEDMNALIDAVGGFAYVFGHSSGAVLALEAAAAGVPITRLAVNEPPYLTDVSGGETSAATAREVQSALDLGDRGSAVEIFLRSTGAPFDPAIKEAPWWPAMTAVAHTLPYDLAIVGNGEVPTERLAKIGIPTLGIYGGADPSWTRGSVGAPTAA